MTGVSWSTTVDSLFFLSCLIKRDERQLSLMIKTAAGVSERNGR